MTITAEELRDQAKFCGPEFALRLNLAADALEAKDKRIAELEANNKETFNVLEQTAAALLRGKDICCRMEKVMEKQAARITELEKNK